MYEKADIKAPEDKSSKHLIIGVTSDRGLCGAIHSGVAKTIKSEIANLTNAGKEVMVVNVGDKLRGLLHRSEENKAAQRCADAAGFNLDPLHHSSSSELTENTSFSTVRKLAASRPASETPRWWPPSCWTLAWSLTRAPSSSTDSGGAPFWGGVGWGGLNQAMMAEPTLSCLPQVCHLLQGGPEAPVLHRHRG